MARYDAEGYNARGQRQILGYSRQVQGGADAARARAAQRLYESQDHLYEDGRQIAARRQRERRVSEAKADGTFDETREAYNEEAADMGSPARMDQAGGIRSYIRQPAKYTSPQPPKKAVASELPRIFRPGLASQRVADTVATTTGEGLLDMARKARRRGTLVVK